MVKPYIISLGIMFGWIAISAIVGVLAYRLKVKVLRLDTYMVAGRRLALLVVFLNMAAVIYSAFAFLGAAGWTYAYGAPVLYIWAYGPLAYSLAFFFAPKIWRVAKEHEILTQPDFFLWRYNSKFLMAFTALIGIAFNIPYAQLQLLGTKYIVELGSYFSIPGMWVVVIVYLLVMVYLFLGGMMSLAITNTIQGAIMLVAMLSMGIIIPIRLCGSHANMFAKLAEVSPAHLVFPGAKGIHPVQWYLSTAIMCGLGFWCFPQLAQIIFPAKSPVTVRRSIVLSSWYHLIGFLPVTFVGLAAFLAFPGLKKADWALLYSVQKLFPAWVLGLVSAGGIAAALSSVSAIFLTQASLFSRNIWQGLIRPKASEREVIWVTRISVIGFILLALYLAWTAPAFLVYLLLVGYSGITQMFPGWILGTYIKWIKREGVIVGIITGIIIVILTTFVWKHPFGIFSGIWGLIPNIVLTLIISYLKK